MQGVKWSKQMMKAVKSGLYGLIMGVLCSTVYAGSVDAVFNLFHPEHNVDNVKHLDVIKSEISQSQLTSKSEYFDVKSQFEASKLNFKQKEILNREQSRIDRLYANALKDGVIDEWESLLLQRAREHAVKLLESSASEA